MIASTTGSKLFKSCRRHPSPQLPPLQEPRVRLRRPLRPPRAAELRIQHGCIRCSLRGLTSSRCWPRPLVGHLPLRLRWPPLRSRGKPGRRSLANVFGQVAPARHRGHYRDRDRPDRPQDPVVIERDIRCGWRHRRCCTLPVGSRCLCDRQDALRLPQYGRIQVTGVAPATTRQGGHRSSRWRPAID